MKFIVLNNYKLKNIKMHEIIGCNFKHVKIKYNLLWIEINSLEELIELRRKIRKDISIKHSRIKEIKWGLEIDE